MYLRFWIFDSSTIPRRGRSPGLLGPSLARQSTPKRRLWRWSARPDLRFGLAPASCHPVNSPPNSRDCHRPRRTTGRVMSRGSAPPPSAWSTKASRRPARTPVQRRSGPAQEPGGAFPATCASRPSRSPVPGPAQHVIRVRRARERERAAFARARQSHGPQLLTLPMPPFAPPLLSSPGRSSRTAS